MKKKRLSWLAFLSSNLLVAASLSVVIAGSLAGAVPSYAIVDGDLDGIDDSVEQTLITKYAPKLYLHPDEDNKPSSVDWYIQRTAMRFHHDGGCSDDQILALGSITQSNMSQQSHKTKNWLCSHSGDPILSS